MTLVLIQALILEIPKILVLDLADIIAGMQMAMEGFLISMIVQEKLGITKENLGIPISLVKMIK